MPSLLDLPRELRDQISAYALTNTAAISIPGIFPHYHTGGASTAPLTRAHLALTQTNRQLRAETRLLFYALNTFAICLQPVNVKFWRLGRKGGKGREEWQKIFRRSYGDLTTAQWLDEIPDEAVKHLRGFAVYFACVLRWQGDEVVFEKAKFDRYKIGDVPVRVGKRMTKHILYDMCSGPQLFYEVDLDAESVESFVEVVERRGGQGNEIGNMECSVCLGALQKWLNSVDVVDGKKRLDRAKVEDLLWPSKLEPTTEPKKIVDPPDSRL